MNKSPALILFLLSVLSATSAFASEGDLDTTFNVNGKVIACCGQSPGRSVAIQSDGKIVTAGVTRNPSTFIFQIWLIRYEANGTLDTGFGTNGEVKTDTVADNDGNIGQNVPLAIQADGKIVVAVWASGLSGNGAFVYRYDANGTLDTSFDSDGVANVHGDTYTDVYLVTSMVIQTDQKILVGVRHHEDVANSPIVKSFGILRFSPNGSLDPTFGSGGFAFTPSLLGNTDSQDVPTGIAVQQDNKIVMVGLARRTDGTTTFGVVRYTAGGTLDTNFDGDGIVTTQIGITGERDEPYSVGIQSDQKIVVAGLSRDNAVPESTAVVRYNTNGSLDTSFDADGKVMTAGGSSTANSLLIQRNGKIIVAGTRFNSSADFSIIRYRANGSLDTTSWGTNGIVTTDFGIDEVVGSLAIQTDGKIVAVGNSSNKLALARYIGTSLVRSNADFDGDGKTDLSIFRPNGATGSEWWYLKSSNGGNYATQFGSPTDKLVAADYTGDGKADIAFFRPSTGFWYILRSEDSSFYAFPFGAAGDVPAPADYDGDGKADAAVFRTSNSTWFIQNSGGGTTIQAFGAAGDLPVVGDYDGDGKADIAIFRPNGTTGSEWWILRSTAGLIATQFGNPTDKTVPGDYTGDGKADIAIWRPSNGQWYILRSEDLSFYAFPFGANGDIPVPGDYDGDGKTDAAVFRPSSSTWFAQGSTSGTIIQQFGAAGDVPVPNEFVR